MAKRGEVWRLSRLDFLTRRAEYWVEAQVDAFAHDYDGSMWFIGAGEDFYAIDATAKRFDAIWRVPDIESHVVSIARSASSCRFLAMGWGFEEWHYELPSLRLRNRNPFQPLWKDEDYIRYSPCLAISADGIIADHSLYLFFEKTSPQESAADTPKILKKISISLNLIANGVLLQEIKTSSDTEQKPVEEYKPTIPSIYGNWVAALVMDENEAWVLLIDVKEGKVRAEIALEKAQEAVVRVQKDVLTIGDNRGRLLVMEINSGHLIRNLRI
jgi:hypothetical protein